MCKVRITMGTKHCQWCSERASWRLHLPRTEIRSGRMRELAPTFRDFKETVTRTSGIVHQRNRNAFFLGKNVFFSITLRRDLPLLNQREGRSSVNHYCPTRIQEKITNHLRELMSERKIGKIGENRRLIFRCV
jgi:hypothetical protein